MSLVKEWVKKVMNYHTEMYETLESNSEARNMFYGIYSIDGKLKEGAEVIVVGYNPGKSGNDKWIKQVEVESGNYISYLDKFQDNYRYHLAEKNISILRKAGLESSEIEKLYSENFIKTNLYHIITADKSSLDICLSKIGRKSNYKVDSCNFTIDLIKIIQPKLVIVEGKSTWEDLVVKGYDTFNRSWNSKYDFGYHFEGETEFVGFNRNTNTDAAAQIIGEILHERKIR